HGGRGNVVFFGSHHVSLIDTVVGRFLGDLDVVHVRLADAGRGDLHEFGTRAQFVYGGAADVAHRGAQPAHQLMDHRHDRTLVGHAPLDAFRHQLVDVAVVVLEVAVAGAFLH